MQTGRTNGNFPFALRDCGDAFGAWLSFAIAFMISLLVLG